MEITYTCSSGTADAYWSDPEHAWDGSSGTYASCDALDYFSDAYIQRLYAYTTATGAGSITKVEIGVRGYKGAYFNWAYLCTTLSGTHYDIETRFKIPLTGSIATYWYDVTSGTSSPITMEDREWENKDINFANLSVYTKAAVPFSTGTCYIDTLYWRVTYSG